MACTPWSNVKCVDQESGTLAHGEALIHEQDTVHHSLSLLEQFTHTHTLLQMSIILVQTNKKSDIRIKP